MITFEVGLSWPEKIPWSLAKLSKGKDKVVVPTGGTGVAFLEDGRYYKVMDFRPRDVPEGKRPKPGEVAYCS